MTQTAANPPIYKRCRTSRNGQGWGPWPIVASTWALTIIGSAWVGGQMLAGGKHELAAHKRKLDAHSRLIENADKRLRIVETAVSETRTDVAWIKATLEAMRAEARGGDG